jgi:hypothetical protein
MIMKKYVFLFYTVLLFSTCAQHRAYDTAEFREREYESRKITLTNEGLTREQIQTISSTRPPSQFPIDLSLIVVKDRTINNELEQMFVTLMIEELKESNNIKRIVPIPKYLLPEKVTFPIIQELGIRTLTEYVIVFIIDEESFFRWTKIMENRFEITSAADYIIVDSQTTAILTSDRLFSQITYEESIFKVGEKKKAQEEIFSEQGQLLGEKLALLFTKTR